MSNGGHREPGGIFGGYIRYPGRRSPRWRSLTPKFATQSLQTSRASCLMAVACFSSNSQVIPKKGPQATAGAFFFAGRFESPPRGTWQNFPCSAKNDNLRSASTLAGSPETATTRSAHRIESCASFCTMGCCITARKLPPQAEPLGRTMGAAPLAISRSRSDKNIGTSPIRAQAAAGNSYRSVTYKLCERAGKG